MRLTKRMQVGAALVVVAVLTSIALIRRDSNPVREDGPLQYTGGEQTRSLSLSLPVAVGEPFSTGILTIENRGPKPLTIEGARLVRREPGMKLLGFYIRKIPGRPIIGLLAGYRPMSGTPLPGYVVAPRAQLSLVVGAELAAPGKHAFRGVAVRYADDSHDYVDVFDVSLRLCAPEVKYIGRKCRTPLATKSLQHP